jgi:hypothetical protein
MACDGETSVIWVSILANSSLDAGCGGPHHLANVYFIKEQCYYASTFTNITYGGSGAWYAMELTELLPHVARGLNIN